MNMEKFDELAFHGEYASLIPMSRSHRDELVAAAKENDLWRIWYTEIPSEDTVDAYFDRALTEKEMGVGVPFVVVEAKTNAIIGTTSFLNIDKANRRLEIGHTWYAKRVQRTAVNTECKLMLLTYAFEAFNAIAVEFRTHWHNHASRQAIARLGAKQDGILRNHRLINGALRDSVIFSIIASEWPTVKQSIRFKLNRF